MFDIGFAELLIIGVVGLLVIGPERLPDAIRTGSAWLNRFRRGFNDIKQEVQQELHNDAVLKELRESGEKLRRETESLQRDFAATSDDSGTGGSVGQRETGSGRETPAAAEQSVGHRETPAPFMRSDQSGATAPADGAGHVDTTGNAAPDPATTGDGADAAASHSADPDPKPGRISESGDREP